MKKSEKDNELKMYFLLNIATLDYTINLFKLEKKSNNLDSIGYLESLKVQVEELYKKGKLTTLKKWFRDFTEMPRETNDLKFNRFIKERTGYEINIFENYFSRVNKIIEKGKITTDKQYYDINLMVDYLCQEKIIDHEKINHLNSLLMSYKSKLK